jgi:hypothetical protein
MLAGVAMAGLVTFFTIGLAGFQFDMEMSIGQVLVQFLPMLSGLGTLAILVGFVLALVGKAEISWKVATAGFLLLLPTALFIGIFGMISAVEMVALFGTELGPDPPVGRLLTAVLLGVPGAALGATLFSGLGAYFVSSSIVQESEETFDRNPTRGMNIMDPSVQKELEEARRKHAEKQNKE